MTVEEATRAAQECTGPCEDEMQPLGCQKSVYQQCRHLGKELPANLPNRRDLQLSSNTNVTQSSKMTGERRSTGEGTETFRQLNLHLSKVLLASPKEQSKTSEYNNNSNLPI
jgi:hypothetical protein